jgi:hypothetical protein
MKKFIEYIGYDHYKKLEQNEMMRQEMLQYRHNFDELEPVVKLTGQHKHLALGKPSRDYCLIAALREDEEGEGIIYCLHTFRSGIPEMSGLLLSDVLALMKNGRLVVDHGFKSEDTLEGYAKNPALLDVLPREEWHRVNSLEERRKYYQKQLSRIEEEIKNPVVMRVKDEGEKVDSF